MQTKVKLTVKEAVWESDFNNYHSLNFFLNGLQNMKLLECIALQENGTGCVSLFSRDWNGFVRVDIGQESGNYYTSIYSNYDEMIEKTSGSLFAPVSFKVTFKTRED